MMDDFDFTRPQAAAPEAAAPFKAVQSRFYDPEVAGRIFREAGREERFEPGTTLFLEDEKSSRGLLALRSGTRMYFVAEGQVALTLAGRPLDVVKAGEIVGEMAVISGQPRTATAAAKTVCVAYSMDAVQLQSALARSPEFALMLASVMYDRLRFLSARLAARKAAPTAAHELAVFDRALLERFEAALPRASIQRHWGGTVIMREGQAGAFMYVVKSGRVVISIRGDAVEVVTAGGTFGEMAVVDQSPRNATATAETECELLQVDRPSLLAAVKGNPAFGMALLKAVAERLRRMTAVLAGK